MMNITDETSVFDAFDDHKAHDDGIAVVETSVRSSKATDLLMIGIILLAIVIVIDCNIRTYYFCKLRKQKRVIAPCPVEMMAATIANGGTNQDEQASTRDHNDRTMQTIDEESATDERSAVVH